MLQELPSVILSNKIFNQDTYKIEKIQSSLKLDDKLSNQIKSNWQTFLEEAHKKGGNPWDADQYRLENIEEVSRGSKKLVLSTIKYSQIKGLTHNTDLSLLPEHSRPNHISTGSLIQTPDGYFLFGERNKNSMSKHSIDLIGGGLQPGEVSVNSTNDIFENQIKEMNEEVGIYRKDITKIIGIGITYSSYFNVIPIFYTLLNLTKEQTQVAFNANNDDEMNNLVFVKETELRDFLKDKGSFRPLVYELYKTNKVNLI